MPRGRHAFGRLSEYLTSPASRAELAAAQQALSRARDQLREAEQRAAVAEQSASDAWKFAKALSGAGRTK